MQRVRDNSIASRSSDFFGALPMGVGLIAEALFIMPSVLIVWAALAALILLGGMLGAGTFYFRKQDLPNGWYRAAYRTGWGVSILLGVVIVGAVVAWAISGATPSEIPSISKVLILIAQVGIFVDAVLIGGLAAAGWFAQGTKETREFARSWGRTHGAAGARSTEEHSPPE